MKERLDFYGRYSHGRHATVYQGEKLALPVHPRPAVTALARGNSATPLAHMALNRMVVQSVVKESRVHKSPKKTNHLRWKRRLCYP
jgi:hypothetical protein